jgi:hypothetical protein
MAALQQIVAIHDDHPRDLCNIPAPRRAWVTFLHPATAYRKLSKAGVVVQELSGQLGLRYVLNYQPDAEAPKPQRVMEAAERTCQHLAIPPNRIDDAIEFACAAKS